MAEPLGPDDLDRISVDLSNRELSRLTWKDLLILTGIDTRLAELEMLYGQLWTGCNVAGDDTDPGTGAETTSTRWYKDIMLGHKASDYTDWTPRIVGSGYTIWSIDPTDYSHHSHNTVRMDNIPLRNEGEATALALSAFDKVYEYDGATYNDHTTEAGTEFGTTFELPSDTSSYLYLGATATFGTVSFNFYTPGMGYNLALEYWNGAAWTALSPTTESTENWVQNGTIKYSVPSDWAQNAVNGVTHYWLRLSSTLTPDRVAEAFYVTPASSVTALLQLSKDDLDAKDYAFCSFGSAMYVAFPSDGDPNYEGSTFIRSGSNAGNVQSYFVTNHELLAFYESAAWTGGQTSIARRLDILESA